MIVLNDNSLSGAAMICLVANTPSFLVRKLKMDPVVRRIAAETHIDELYKELETRLHSIPQTFTERVIPFVIVVALLLKQATADLRLISEDKLKLYSGLAEVIEFASRVTKTSSSITLNFRPPTKVDLYPSMISQAPLGSKLTTSNLELKK
jgi:hypothetical protein